MKIANEFYELHTRKGPNGEWLVEDVGTRKAIERRLKNYAAGRTYRIVRYIQLSEVVKTIQK